MSIAAPSGPQPRLPALRLVQSSQIAWRLANTLLVAMALCIVAMIFVPWQQSARGMGKVVAYVPQERQQTVTSPAKGIVLNVAEGLREGMRVERGDFILEIEPSAANLGDQLKQQLADYKAKLDTETTKVDVYQQNVGAFTEAQKAAVEAADQMIESAKAEWDGLIAMQFGYEAKELQARLNLKRQKELSEKGIKPTVEIEKLQKDWEFAKAELENNNKKIESAEKKFEAKKSERTQKLNETQTKIDYARAMRQDALGKAATVRKETRDIEIKLAELDRQTINAPRAGTIFRMPVYERGQAIKQGDPLFTIVPDASERIVELWVSGNDMPLVQQGDHVRLQFEGWPAVQFAGWPSVAVGTFGGEVAAIDPTDDGAGKFRIQVQATSEQPWPTERYLRQGVRANGWVMLNQVPLGFEIWRQLNGFPPSVSQKPEKDAKDEMKKVKLPK